MKKILAVLFALALVLGFAGCSDDNADDTTAADEATTVSTVGTTEATEPEAEPVTEVPKGAEPVAVGNIITVPFAEMTIKEAAFADDIKQSIKTGNHTRISGPDRSDEKEFVYIRGTIKNTSKTAISARNIEGNVDIDGYVYEIGTINVIESDGSTASSLEPLMEYTYTIYAEVPNALVDIATSAVLTFEFMENFEYMSSDDKGEYVYAITIAK